MISKDLAFKKLSYVIPFYDSGIDAESTEYFVVMAKAEKSLQQLIDCGAVPERDAINVLTDIAHGLHEVGDIVHRDLKPGNVLYHQDKWKLADFGIARFVEESTSINTLKDCLTKQYAAPEQWRFERATKATDVYAFGCISFALLTGQPPFTSGDFRQRHLHEDPPTVPGSTRMQQLISLCLRKNTNARPSVDSIICQLEAISTVTTSHAGIAAAGAAIAIETAKKEADLSRKRSEEEERRELAKDAFKSLDLILEALFKTIQSDAQVAQRISQREIELGYGKLKIEILFPLLPKDAFSRSNKNIICGVLISIEQNVPHYRGRSANLWFGEYSPGEYRWHEISYFNWTSSNGTYFKPFGITSQNEIHDADYAAAQIIYKIRHAADPVPIDREYTDDFINRWLNRLAEAASNRLQEPRYLPEN